MDGSETDTGGTERDSTQDWLLPAEATPPLVGELEAKVDEAIAIARGSEAMARSSDKVARSSEQVVRAIGAQVTEIGDQAADAAAQARRAADLAERASEAALTAASASAPQPDAGALEDAWLRGFTERADRVMARLQAVERRFTPARG
jgi:methyl-accepting chemotaxis protein